jgi:hypothetical protein
VDAQLRVARGGLWLTLDVQRPEPGRASGDIFLAAGEHICIPAGRVAVIEPWSSDSLCASYFSWDALAVDMRAPVHLANRWQVSVRQPLVDMGVGLSQENVPRSAAWLGSLHVQREPQAPTRDAKLCIHAGLERQGMAHFQLPGAGKRRQGQDRQGRGKAGDGHRQLLKLGKLSIRE